MTNSTLDEDAMRAVLEKLKAIPPRPEIFWTALLSGNKAYTRAGRNYISLAAVQEFKCSPARPGDFLPAFYTVDILCAEDVAREAMGFRTTLQIDPNDLQDTIGVRVMRDLIAIANAEYGDKAGAALQSAFYRPPLEEEKKDD